MHTAASLPVQCRVQETNRDIRWIDWLTHTYKEKQSKKLACSVHITCCHGYKCILLHISGPPQGLTPICWNVMNVNIELKRNECSHTMLTLPNVIFGTLRLLWRIRMAAADAEENKTLVPSRKKNKKNTPHVQNITAVQRPHIGQGIISQITKHWINKRRSGKILIF